MLEWNSQNQWTRISGDEDTHPPPPYNVVVALEQGTRPLSAVNAALMQVTLAHDGLSGSSATALGT